MTLKTMNPIARRRANQEYKRYMTLLNLKHENQLITYALMSEASKAAKK